MSISDWSSDVCSSDLLQARRLIGGRAQPVLVGGLGAADAGRHEIRRMQAGDVRGIDGAFQDQTGRASCRERVCQYVKLSVVAESLNKQATSIHTTTIRAS